MPARPAYPGARLSHATDNRWSTDRYCIYFTDGTALVIWINGSHSAWLDDAPPVLPGERVRYESLPAPVRAEVARRCDELTRVYGA
jgi:hypothetical protein